MNPSAAYALSAVASILAAALPHSYEGAELISLFLTVPTILMGAMVVALYWTDFARCYPEFIRGRPISRTDWLCIGIWSGFIGGVIDNAYWAVPWTMSYLDSPLTQSWVAWGVWPNIFDRQISGSWAAFCHVQAATLPHEMVTDDESVETITLSSRKLAVTMLVGSIILGGLYVGLLYWLKNG